MSLSYDTDINNIDSDDTYWQYEYTEMSWTLRWADFCIGTNVWVVLLQNKYLNFILKNILIFLVVSLAFNF